LTLSIQYINAVVCDRRNSYDPIPDLDISDINCVKNGILMRADLHRIFGLGDIAFLQVCGTVDMDPHTF